MGDNRAISGQPNAATRGTWNPGLEVSGAASPEPGDGDLQQAGVHHNGVAHQGDPPMNQRLAKETIQGGRSQWSWFNAGKSIEIEMPSQRCTGKKITIPLLRKEFHRSGQTQAEEEPDLETTPSMTSSRY